MARQKNDPNKCATCGRWRVLCGTGPTGCGEAPRPVPRLEMVVGSPRVFVRIGPALRFEGVARCHCGTEWVTTLKQQTASHKKALAAAREAPLAEGWGITANHQGTVVVVACPWCRAGHGVDGRDIDMEATP